MSNIVLLSYSHTSNWTSCSYLLNEIEETYKVAFPDNLIHLQINENDPNDKINILEHVARLAPSIVVFIDHRMNYLASWINEIKSRIPINHKIHWGIHAFGCFMGRTKEWIDLSEALNQDFLSILCASSAQQNSAAFLFQNTACVKLFRIPYKNKIHLRASVREKLRYELNLKDDEFAIIYAGRISYQKNVHHLIKLTSEYHGVNANKIRLFICGDPDNVNPREFPHAYYHNYAMELFSQELTNANKNRKLVTHLGNLEEHALYDLFHAMDCAISLSTHEGDDYGRSLVESLAMGLPVIATHWGGHKDLIKLPQVKTIKLLVENETIKLNRDDLQDYFDTLQFSDRDANQLAFEKEFSLQKAAHILVNLYDNEQRSGGFTKKAVSHVYHLETNWKKREFFINYEQVLRSYWD